MKLVKVGKQNGCNQYHIYGMRNGQQEQYWGWLIRVYSPRITVFGREPAYEWEIELHSDVPRWYDDTFWDTFKEAKEWLNENIP